MGDANICSGFIKCPEGHFICKHGHKGPGTSVCQGVRYTNNSQAPCEREDLFFDEENKCINWLKEK